MAKEMIVSVNGREKKIAIIENGRLAEFYIERGEDNSGIVGNIYKGKVHRVLPGMQSAFVDIGLERDAFLYVSDFFDEEEELERIMLEKSKKLSAETAEVEASAQIQKARIEHEHQIEELHQISEPGVSDEFAEPRAESAAPIGAERAARPTRGRSRRGRGGRGPKPEMPVEAPVESEPVIPFEFEPSSFERVSDDEETTGDMFKDAYLQEAIVDRVRAVEFDVESTPSAEVGSLYGSIERETSGFERVADEDDTGFEMVQPKTADYSTLDEEAEPVSFEPEEKSKKPSPRRSALSKLFRGSKPAKKKSEKESLEDGDAEILILPDIPEFAVRRGGRRRRGSGSKARIPVEQVEGDELALAEAPVVAEEIAEAKPQQPQNNRRPSRDSRRSQPKITDLLREGQEVLVQMAKEPIARKGARITSHIALPGRYVVYMPTIEHLGVSKKIDSANERARLRTAIQKIRAEEDIPSGGFIVRTAGIGAPEDGLRDDARFLVRTWLDIKKNSEKKKSPALVHQDLDLVQRLLRDLLSEDFAAIRIDSEEEYLRIVEFINRMFPAMVKRVKLYSREQPILESYGVQEEIDKALKPRVWLKSGGYLVINQTEALVAIDVNTGKFVGKGNARLEDTITKTNMEAVEEIARQIRLRDLGGIIVLDLIDMEDRRNRHRVMQALQEALYRDKSPTKVLSYNDFGLIIMTRKRVKQSLERTLCTPCGECQGAGWVKSAQTVCYEILEEARRLSKSSKDVRMITLRVNPEVARALQGPERNVLEEIEAYLGVVDVSSDPVAHQEQFDFAVN